MNVLTQIRSWGILSAVIAALCTAGIASAAPEDGKKEQAPALAFELTEGSHVIGVPAVSSVKVVTSYGTFDIPLKHVESIEFGDAKGSLSVALHSGMLVKGVLEQKQFEVTTILGKATIGVEHIQRIRVWPGGYLGPALRRGLVLYYPFDKEARSVEEKVHQVEKLPEAYVPHLRGTASEARLSYRQFVPNVVVKTYEHVTDASGRGNHGKGHAIARTADRFGKPDKALLLDGKSAYVSTPHSPTLDTRDTMTVALWVRPADTSRTVFGCLAGKDVWNYGQQSWDFWYRPDQKDFCFSATGPKHGKNHHQSCALYSESKLSSSQWSHVAGVFNSGHVRIYLNGRLEAEKHIDFPRLGGSATGPPFTVGWVKVGTGKYFFEGALDEVMLYNRALSDGEIKQLYNLQK